MAIIWERRHVSSEQKLDDEAYLAAYLAARARGGLFYSQNSALKAYCREQYKGADESGLVTDLAAAKAAGAYLAERLWTGGVHAGVVWRLYVFRGDGLGEEPASDWCLSAREFRDKMRELVAG